MLNFALLRYTFCFHKRRTLWTIGCSPNRSRLYRCRLRPRGTRGAAARSARSARLKPLVLPLGDCVGFVGFMGVEYGR